MTPRPRILVVEDHPLVREGLRMLLTQTGMEVCGEAESRAEALMVLAATRPDLLMVDLTLWEESGLDLIRALPEGEGEAPVLVYSMHEDWLHVRQAFQAGADGYVTKRELPEVLIEAIWTLLSGGVYTSPRALRAIAETEMRLEGIEQFSGQEMEIFQRLGMGLGVGGVADAMDLSRKTVESYCERMIVKVGLRGMRELRLLAVAHPMQ
jgi:DNA-binding NarL/FixJ family response regulator